MRYAVVYSSRTGNTGLLAETVRDILPGADCIYFGPPAPEAMKADRIYVGFWTDRGTCDGQTAAFLKSISAREVFLFGTAGFGENQKYFRKILKRTERHLCRDVRLTGSFMCQGRMPMTVRARYEKMEKAPLKIPHLRRLIENFDRALAHPDAGDLEMLRKAVQSGL